MPYDERGRGRFPPPFRPLPPFGQPMPFFAYPSRRFPSPRSQFRPRFYECRPYSVPSVSAATTFPPNCVPATYCPPVSSAPPFPVVPVPISSPPEVSDSSTPTLPPDGVPSTSCPAVSSAPPSPVSVPVSYPPEVFVPASSLTQSSVSSATVPHTAFAPISSPQVYVSPPVSQPMSTSPISSPQHSCSTVTPAESLPVIVLSDEDEQPDMHDEPDEEGVPKSNESNDRKRKGRKKQDDDVWGALPMSIPSPRKTRSSSSKAKIVKQNKSGKRNDSKVQEQSEPTRDQKEKSLDFMLQRVIFHTQGECDEAFVKSILGGVISTKCVNWNDIGGLQQAKQQLKELVVWPILNAELFRGLRSPGKGLLLYGPPGTGKTMIGKCLATNAKATFFSISASTFASKWYGDAEKTAKTLFQCARALQPSIIFIDEVDALLSNRKDNDGGCTTRLKNELLTHMDGCGTLEEDRILVIGATNLPQNVDEAARRRFTRRVYIPLPDKESRAEIMKRMLNSENHSIQDFEFDILVDKTDGYSGADLRVVLQGAAMEPIRSLPSIQFATKDMSVQLILMMS